MIALRGTFLDEITHDIPSQNWTAEDWARDFDAMEAIGIDTVILIRAGYRKQATFNSDVLRKEMEIFPVYKDLVQLFLDQAERCNMKFYFGLYDSGHYWTNQKYQKEVDINKALTEEVILRYGNHPAFGGWYFSHEIGTYEKGVMKVYRQMADHLKNLRALPILISPYVKGKKQFGEQKIEFSDHTNQWRKVFDDIADVIDIVAFQDGQVEYDELTDYLNIHKSLADEYDIKAWSNVESFDRDMPIKFPPIPYKNLRYKMEQAHKAGITDMVTFEFSHFMSPNSMYPAAHGLYKQYCQWLSDQQS